MATISPSVDSLYPGGIVVTWANMATGDTIDPYTPVGPVGAIGSFQATGTFAGGTVVGLKGSNDQTNFVRLKDVSDTDISMTGAGLVDFSTAAREIKPDISAGTADSVTVTVVMRG